VVVPREAATTAGKLGETMETFTSMTGAFRQDERGEAVP
jgi:hypothetical protein